MANETRQAQVLQTGVFLLIFVLIFVLLGHLGSVQTLLVGLGSSGKQF